MLVAFVLSFILAVILASVSFHKIGKAGGNRNVRCLILLVLSIMVIWSVPLIMLEGASKGIQLNFRMSIQEYIEEYKVSPHDDSNKVYSMLKDDSIKDGTTIIFYRADCDDCKKELPKYKYLDRSDKVYFVCTRTHYGELLKKEVGVHWTPSVYIYKNGKLSVLGNEKESINYLNYTFIDELVKNKGIYV